MDSQRGFKGKNFWKMIICLLVNAPDVFLKFKLQRNTCQLICAMTRFNSLKMLRSRLKIRAGSKRPIGLMWRCWANLTKITRSCLKKTCWRESVSFISSSKSSEKLSNIRRESVKSMSKSLFSAKKWCHTLSFRFNFTSLPKSNST